jgi:formate-dependent nitrite reductase membrane component NrfD
MGTKGSGMTNGYERNWAPRRAGRSAGDVARDSYYDLPVVKAPHWDWKIVLYFFLGGIAGASYVVACIAELIGGRTNAQIARVGHYVALAALIPSPLLLILDLGRPERFHHMLRVVKLRSPMSVGTWGLSAFGLFATASALRQAARDGLFGWLPVATRLLLALPNKPLNIAGSFWGFFVGGYTGVLLGITAIPLWAKNHLLLGPLFLSSAMSSAVATMTLILALVRGDSKLALKRLHRIETVALLSELSLLVATWANSGPVIGRPLRQGRLGQLLRWGVGGVGIAAPLVLQLRETLGGKPSRAATVLGSLCALVGGYCVRHLFVYAGHASAADPQATFVYTRRTH